MADTMGDMSGMTINKDEQRHKRADTEILPSRWEIKLMPELKSVK